MTSGTSYAILLTVFEMMNSILLGIKFFIIHGVYFITLFIKHVNCILN